MKRNLKSKLTYSQCIIYTHQPIRFADLLNFYDLHPFWPCDAEHKKAIWDKLDDFIE